MELLFKLHKLKILKQVFEAIISSPLRSFFCISGISIGIVSITLIIASIDGANRRANQLMSDFGPDSIIIFSGSEQMRSARLRINTITLDDMEEIKTKIAGCYETIPMVARRNTTVVYKDKKWQTFLIGSTIGYFTSWGWRIKAGSTYTEKDIEESGMVTVIGSDICDKLFDGDPNKAIGETILVNNKPVVVIGVMKERGAGFGGMRLDDRIIMPYTTVMKRFLNERRYISAVRARFYGDLDIVIDNVKKLLRQRHNIKEGQPDDFTIRTAEDVKKFLSVIQGTLILFLGITGGITLVIGGFVMTNLFMISVQERKKEIGIKRAFGAKKSDIIFQFISESVTLALIGSVFGLILGLISGYLITKFTSIPIMFSYKVFWVSSIVSGIVGIVAGIIPAKRASELDPVEAIRS